MVITAQMVKELRDTTGAGPLDCKNALVACDGDIKKSIELLNEKNLIRVKKKLGAGRTMNEGVVENYMHFNKRVGVMVEVNCETDFVANTGPFQQFAKDVAMHIANMKPEYVSREYVPEAVVEVNRQLYIRQAEEEGKPANIAEKIAEGRLKKFFEDVVLMDQKFIKDDKKTISDLLNAVVAEVGESVEISRFACFEVGN